AGLWSPNPKRPLHRTEVLRYIWRGQYRTEFLPDVWSGHCRRTGPAVPVDPSWRREERDRDREAEEDLREARVRRGNRRGQEEEDRQAAEHALRDNGAERGDTEPAHPASRLPQPQPGGEHDGQETDARRDESVGVLVEDAADHFREREREHVPAIGGRPIGNRESRAGDGDQDAGEREKNRAAGDELGEPVKHLTRQEGPASPARKTSRSSPSRPRP